MVIVEFRIPMPFSAEEYQIGQLYTIAKKSKLESSKDGKGGGVKIITNEPYSNGPGGCGQYTNKTYYLANRIPDWMKRLLPESAAKLKEEAWNAYPYSKNKFTNPLLDKLTLEIESHYLDGPPTVENAFDLSRREESSRSIVIIDLANDRHRTGARQNNNNNYKASSEHQSSSHIADTDVLAFDPLFREPLTQDWLQEYELAYERRQREHKRKNLSAFVRDVVTCNDDVDDENDVNQAGDVIEKRLMTCYKLCRINFPVWPIQNKVEQFIQQYCRDTIIESHRQAWLWQDEWTGMSLDQIREMEDTTKKDLFELMRQSSLN